MAKNGVKCGAMRRRKALNGSELTIMKQNAAVEKALAGAIRALAEARASKSFPGKRLRLILPASARFLRPPTTWPTARSEPIQKKL